MRVKQLKMRSFRGIDDLTLDFDETEPTVLIGINGVGKSSILDCLAILFSQVVWRIKGSSFDSVLHPNEQDITNGREITENEITISSEIFQEAKWFEIKRRKANQENIINNSDYLQLVHFVAENITKKNLQERLTDNDWKEIAQKLLQEMVRRALADSDVTEVQLREFLSNNESLLDDEWKEIKQRVLESIIHPVKAIETSFREIQKLGDYIHNSLQKNHTFNIPLFVYYPINRAVVELPLEISKRYSFNQIEAYEQALTGGKIDFKSFFEWFRNREDLENELRRDEFNYRDSQLQGVRQAISSLMPKFSNLRVQRSPLRMTVNKQGQELIVNQLSDGEKCLLAMVGDLARRLAIANPSLENPLEGSGIVLIDEIELHLHPKWQREIIPALTRTFPNCQFIVTTHSPQVVSHVKPEGIYILEATDTGVVAKRPESSYGRDSNRILEDLMGVPERPLEIKNRLRDLFRLIDEGNLDGARELQKDLVAEIGADEPDFASADVLIRRREILGR
ncbi:AAA family ATPase [Chroococcidiopsis sp. CCNUC1]|uniref:AAA family ATPase n=1 Tax=Chroococcidiopsis sp. CCNUC1 TaxID=2653189 RepID=UPI00202271F9|nr:AAA family ATPase [Chroococcidiopsis sp. CCNUC1]URD52391.1 AAA family ATPase [Chroococcidiopsis sp. CCNUC1]